MKRVRIVLCYGLLAIVCRIAHADEPWLLLSHQSGEDSVAVPVGSALHTIAMPGHVVSYGQSDRVLGFLSYQIPLARHVLTLIDGPTQAVTASVLIDMHENVHPVQWMSGAILNLVLTGQFAYFVSYTHAEGADGPDRNPSGGIFDLDRVTLADGKLEQFPLPKDCVNPRIVDFGGTPLVYSWEGFGVSKFDVAKRRLVTLVSIGDVGDIIEREGKARDVRRGPETAIFSNYVVVPGAGAFRLSRVGELQQILNANLTLVSLPRRTVKLANPGEQPEILLGRFHGAPAIGVVRNLGDHLEFRYIDPATFNVEWETTLPKSANIPSIYGLSDNAVVYLDQALASIARLTQQGTTVMHKVSADDALYGVKILSIDDARDPERAQ
jgi:hypothetical protein